jgi:lysophospholipase L1-like esterase
MFRRLAVLYASLCISLSASTVGILAKPLQASTPEMLHIVLLGDSIFDNKSYLSHGEPDVRNQLQDLVGSDGGRVTLLARDADVARGVSLQQSKHIPKDATHLVLSVGGNDALGVGGHARMTLGDMFSVMERFEREYDSAVHSLASHKLPILLVMPYYPRFPPEMEMMRVAKAGMTVFYDVIMRTAQKYECALLDLRTIFREDDDYANPIEPSAKGGEKMVRAILHAVRSMRSRPSKSLLLYHGVPHVSEHLSGTGDGRQSSLALQTYEQLQRDLSQRSLEWLNNEEALKARIPQPQNDRERKAFDQLWESIHHQRAMRRG